MSGRLRLVAIGVALLAVVGVAVVAVSLAGPPDALPSASASSSAAASATASATASASIPASPLGEEETMAALREIEAQVIAIRGLPAAEIGPADLISREQLADELARIFEVEYPPEDQARDNAALQALGLLDEGQDVAELQLRLLGDQVLGFYDDVDKRMVVVTDVGLDAEAKLTYAHEYTHALQDAAFGLDSLQTDAVGEDDRGLARTALIEGDATVSMLAWAFENLTPQELAQVATGTPLPDTTGIPSWMVEQLQFPYTDGLTWASTIAGDPLQPDFTALDAAFGDPPDSTEQILDLGKWEPREVPTPVEGVDLATALGDGWNEVDATPIGEEGIRTMLAFHGVDRDLANGAGAGWGGDRAVIAAGPNDAFAVAWRLAWDTAADGQEFADAYRGILGALPFAATVSQLSGGDVLVVHASSDDLLRRTLDAADG
jgi:hypothetical protein